jgi:hypothetical protein
MSDSGPGVVLICNTGKRVPDSKFNRLEPGDLVSFDADTNDGSQIDHVGIYLGQDGSRNYRFLSSRKTINGPTLGDCNGASILNGGGHYADGFRSARRF